MGSCLYQTVGQGMIEFIVRTQAPDVPFYRKVIDGTTSVCFVMGGRIGAHASHQTFMILPLLRPLPKSRPLTTPTNAVRVRNLAGQPHYGIRMENNSFGPIQRLQIPHHIQTTVRTPCKIRTRSSTVDEVVALRVMRPTHLSQLIFSSQCNSYVGKPCGFSPKHAFNHHSTMCLPTSSIHSLTKRGGNKDKD